MPSFLIEAEDSPTYPALSFPDKTDFAALVAAMNGSGIVTAPVITPLGTPGYAVDVVSGTCFSGGQEYPLIPNASLAPSVASANDRRDIVYVNGPGGSEGVVAIAAGTPCSVAGWTIASGVNPPVKPAIPANCVFLQELYIPGGGGNITAANFGSTGTQVPGAAGLYLNAQDLMGVRHQSFGGPSPTISTAVAGATVGFVNAAYDHVGGIYFAAPSGGVASGTTLFTVTLGTSLVAPSSLLTLIGGAGFNTGGASLGAGTEVSWEGDNYFHSRILASFSVICGQSLAASSTYNWTYLLYGA